MPAQGPWYERPQPPARRSSHRTWTVAVVVSLTVLAVFLVRCFQHASKADEQDAPGRPFAMTKVDAPPVRDLIDTVVFEWNSGFTYRLERLASAEVRGRLRADLERFQTTQLLPPLAPPRPPTTLPSGALEFLVPLESDPARFLRLVLEGDPPHRLLAWTLP